MTTDDDTAARRWRRHHDIRRRHPDLPSWITAALIAIPPDDFHPRHPDADRSAGPDRVSPAAADIESVELEGLAVMLTALDVHDNARVLLLPTGSGYSTAMLAYHVGSDNVIGVDVDAVRSGRARAALRAAGCYPTLVDTDTIMDGWPHQGPYDRILSTYAVDTVPPVWIEQTRPGGVIVTGLWRGTAAQPVIALRVDADGGASGRILPHIPGHRLPPAPGIPTTPTRLDLAAATLAAASVLHVRPAHDAITRPDFMTYATLGLTGVHALHDPDTDCLWYVDEDDRAVRIERHAPYRLYAHSGDRFADQLLAAYARWTAAGSPTADQLGATVSPHGLSHRYWLNTPNQPLWTYRDEFAL
jgi:protein-L-isoaspartate(D-aspartate) O-methyltransferase